MLTFDTDTELFIDSSFANELKTREVRSLFENLVAHNSHGLKVFLGFGFVHFTVWFCPSNNFG